jgi:hypothetical protein
MADPLRSISVVLLGVTACAWLDGIAEAQLTPYNPYADSQESQPPVAADGTLNWGSFYKSAAMQKSYERLWNMGACRGNSKSITIPVERNKLAINTLPEVTFSGRVRGTAGTSRGGLIAFAEGGAVDDSEAPVIVAQLHPAGVTHLQIGGPMPLAALHPGMTVRLRAQVDDKGRATAPVRAIDVVSPPDGFVPDAVRPGAPGTIVGDVQRITDRLLVVQVAAGRLRRLSIPLSAETSVAVVDSSRLDLVSPGDSLEVTGRRWTGDGCMGAATVFASRLVVKKPAPVPDGHDPLASGTK